MKDASNATWKLNTGAPIPVIGIGTVDTRTDDDAVVASIVAGLKIGYRCIDTAMIYKNEHLVGRAIRESSVPREEIFVTTKLWNADIRADRVEAAFDESLKTLGLDYVDLYLVHWPIADKLVSSWKAMETIHAGGKAKAIGVSNFQPRHLDLILGDAKVVPALNQVEFHPWLQQKPLRAYCAEKGILVQAWMPFGRGRLFGDPVLRELAEKYGRTEAQIALRWEYQSGVATIPKSANPERIASNARIFDFAISPEDSQWIEAMDCGRRLGGDPDNFNF